MTVIQLIKHLQAFGPDWENCEVFRDDIQYRQQLVDHVMREETSEEKSRFGDDDKVEIYFEIKPERIVLV